MAKGEVRYISKPLIRVIEREQKKLKMNNRVKGKITFAKACDVIARRYKQ